jgi:enamine deaminase RidA (YjgF/YER057c/UK114 family)
MTRRSIDVTGFRHSTPIPAATRIGPLVVSSIIVARDPGADTIPDSIDAQIANLFSHVGEMLAAAGADWRHVAKMTFYVADIGHRAAINTPWVAHFPDAASRPARHTLVGNVETVQCDFVAYVDD